MAETETEKVVGDMLTGAAEFAGEGICKIVVLGKVVGSQTYAARDGRPAETVFKVVVDEGESWGLKFPAGAATPALHSRGAFIVSDLYKGKNGMSAACDRFTAAV